jgi:hypothetical protein
MTYSFPTSLTRLYLQYMGASGNNSFVAELYLKPLTSGMDDNVPPWHTREAVSVLREWNPDADVTYVLAIVFRLDYSFVRRYAEEPSKPHWWTEVLKNTRVQAFLDRVHCTPYNAPKTKCHKFTLTVAVPAESGPMRGWQVLALEVPGRLVMFSSHLIHGFTCHRLARLEVCEDDEGRINVKASNIRVFSVDFSEVFVNKLVVGGHNISVMHASTSRDAGTLWLEQIADGSSTSWKVTSSRAP